MGLKGNEMNLIKTKETGDWVAEEEIIQFISSINQIDHPPGMEIKRAWPRRDMREI